MKIKAVSVVPKKELEDKIVFPLYNGKREDEHWACFPNRQARRITFKNGETMTVSKDYVFLNQHERQVFAEDLTPGMLVLNNEQIFEVVSVQETTQPLYGYYSASRRSDSLCGLMEKLAKRRDYWYTKNGKEMVLNWSFCLGPDEVVLTSDGPIPVSHVEELSNRNLKIWNGTSFVPKKSWREFKNSPAVCILFKDGDEIIASENHPFKDMSGEPVFARDLEVGQKLQYVKTCPPQGYSAREYLRGLFRIFIRRQDSHSYGYFAHNAEDGMEYITKALDACDIPWEIIPECHCNYKERVVLYADAIKSLKDMLLTEKRFARFLDLRTLKNPSALASYLRGVFDSEGFVHDSVIEIHQYSESVAMNTLRLFQCLGFQMSIESITQRRSARPLWVLTLKGGIAANRRFRELIGSNIDRKFQLLQLACAMPDGYVPVLDEGKEITAIAHIISDVYGPEELKDGWYAANGLYNHNTPFTAKNQTVFQFAGCMAGLKNKKTLSPAVEKARQLNMKFRVGTSSDVSTLAQVLTLGDRRLNNVIWRAYKEKAVDYYGGMGTGPDSVEKFAKILKEETGHDYVDYGEEKWLNMIMPWDFIDIGMTKEHLKERYLQARSLQNSPFGCFVRCVQCGACMVSQDSLPKTPSGKDYRPFLWRREVANGETLEDFKMLMQKYKHVDVQRYILELDVFNPDLRYLDRKKFKLYLQRAYIRSGFPARKKKELFTDAFRFQNWSYGKDYCTGNLYEKITDSTDTWLERLNVELEPLGIRATRLETYSMDTHPADTFEYAMYEIKTDFDINKVQAGIKKFEESDEYIVKVKVPGMMRDSWVTKEIDAKQDVRNIWAAQVGAYTIIRMISRSNIGIYEVLPSLVGTSQKNVKRFPVKRLEYFKAIEEGALDFFDATDEETGNIIEKNIFDEPISEDTEAVRLPFVLDDTVELGAEFAEEDEASDAEAQSSEEFSPSATAMSTENDVTDLAGEGDTLDMSDEEDNPLDLS